MRYWLLLICVCFGSSSLLFGQESKGDKFYNSGDYLNAIPFYEKAARKGSNTKLYEKLGNCYRYTKNYIKAEQAYAKGVSSDTLNPFLHFLYGNALRYNSKNEEAKVQFLTYMRLAPADDAIREKIKSLDDLSIMLSRSLQYKIDPVKGINTSKAEFSPVFYQNGIVFTAERFNDLIDVEAAEGREPNIDLYFQEIRIADSTISVVNKEKPFYEKLNSLSPDGPCSFNKERNMIVFARLESNDRGVVRSKIYFSYSNFDKKRWIKPTAFQYNSTEHSIAHPSLSEDGSILYFASDMPGGLGGKDIYMSRKTDEGWSGPENLGPSINTAGDELFPYIYNDTLLYFSSEGHPGFGGLDIFSSTNGNRTWSKPKNIGPPINSATDDFGIAIDTTGKKGLFSSDRVGGRGDDDIYSFIQTGKLIEMSGRILLSSNINDPAKEVKVLLLTEDGKIISSMLTDSNGFFNFKELDPRQQYLVKLDDSDPSLKKQKEYFMEDKSKNTIVRVTVLNDRGEKFVYENLTSDENKLSKLDIDDHSTSDFSGYLLYGESPMKPLANIQIHFKTDTGSIKKSTTNSQGFFVFRNIDPGKNFMIEADEKDPRLKGIERILVADKKGKIVMVLNMKGGVFQYQYLATQQNSYTPLFVKDEEIKRMISGRIVDATGKQPAANVSVMLLNAHNEGVDTTRTDQQGRFIFHQLTKDENFLVVMDANDPALKGQRYQLFDGSGKLINEFVKNNNMFTYKVLANDHSALTTLYADDVSFPRILAGRIVNAKDKTPLAKMGLSIVTSTGTVIQRETTDDHGRFIFKKLSADGNYLVQLDESDPRIKAIEKILLLDENGRVIKELDMGLDKNHLYELLASEQNALEKIEVQDALFVYDLKGQLTKEKTGKKSLANVRVKLLNADGLVVAETTTDSTGKFLFRKLPIDEQYHFIIDAEEPGLRGLNQVYFLNTSGAIVQTIVRNANDGNCFKYQIIGSNVNKYSEVYTEDIGLAKEYRGKLQANGKDVSNMTINIIDAAGNIVATAQTDANGNFVFTELENDQNYMLSIDANDPRAIAFKNVSIINNNGQRVDLNSKQGKDFTYELLAGDVNKLGTEVYTDDAGPKEYRGKLKSDGKNIGNMTVNLYDAAGRIVATTKTDAFGNFVFKELDADQNYMLNIDASDPRAVEYKKISVVNNNGQQIDLAAKKGKDFTYELLANDVSKLNTEATTDHAGVAKEYRGKLKADGNAISGMTVKLVDSQGNVVATAKTNEQGDFVFTELKADQNLLLVIDANDPRAAAFKNLSLVNGDNKELALNSKTGKDFTYELLSGDINKLSTEARRDSPLSLYLKKKTEAKKTTMAPVVAMELSPLFFDYDQFDISSTYKTTLDSLALHLKMLKKQRVELYGHTDSKGSFSYNKELSQKRAKAVKIYLVKKGVPASRIRIYGIGPEKPLSPNTLVDNSDNPDGRKKNRRVEIKITTK